MRHVYLMAVTVEAPDSTHRPSLDEIVEGSAAVINGDLDAVLEASHITATAMRTKVMGRVSGDDTETVDWLGDLIQFTPADG